ncbi:MAG: HD-GYP domain-containing protein [Cellvibrionaceae bacterium]
MGNLKRISIEQLALGMYVEEINDEWAADSNLKASGLITRDSTIATFRSMGVAELYIDVSKGDDCIGSVSVDDIQQRANKEASALFNDPNSLLALAPQVPFQQAIDEAKEIRHKALSLAGDVMQDVKMGRSFDRSAVDSIANDITDSLVNNQNALQSLMQIRMKDQYLLEHSMNVAVLMGVLARSMKIDGEELHQLVFGAFVHDIGKIRIPEEILYKPGRLDPEDWAEMQRHVIYGMETLETIEGIPDRAKAICAQHHERLDGTGYPFKLKGPQISLYGCMAAVVDVYDAITADRVYHKGMEPTVALKKMLEWTDSHLDKSMVYQLIRCVSVYPAGSTVELVSGHVAVVQEANLQKPGKPKVVLVYDTQSNKKIEAKHVNLASTDLYGGIKSAVDPARFELKLDEYLC